MGGLCFENYFFGYLIVVYFVFFLVDWMEMGIGYSGGIKMD